MKTLLFALLVIPSVLISKPLVNPRQIVGGTYHTCALDDEGVKCWGTDVLGVLNVRIET